MRHRAKYVLAILVVVAMGVKIQSLIHSGWFSKASEERQKKIQKRQHEARQSFERGNQNHSVSERNTLCTDWYAQRGEKVTSFRSYVPAALRECATFNCRALATLPPGNHSFRIVAVWEDPNAANCWIGMEQIEPRYNANVKVLYVNSEDVLLLPKAQGIEGGDTVRK